MHFRKNDLGIFLVNLEKGRVFSTKFEKYPISAAPPAPRGSDGGGGRGAQGGVGLPQGADGAVEMGLF